MDICWFCGEIVSKVYKDHYNNYLCKQCYGTDISETEETINDSEDDSLDEQV